MTPKNGKNSTSEKPSHTLTVLDDPLLQILATFGHLVRHIYSLRLSARAGGHVNGSRCAQTEPSPTTERRESFFSVRHVFWISPPSTTRRSGVAGSGSATQAYPLQSGAKVIVCKGCVLAHFS